MSERGLFRHGNKRTRQAATLSASIAYDVLKKVITRLQEL